MAKKRHLFLLFLGVEKGWKILQFLIEIIALFGIVFHRFERAITAFYENVSICMQKCYKIAIFPQKSGAKVYK